MGRAQISPRGILGRLAVVGSTARVDDRRLPERYQEHWQAPFHVALAEHLRPGAIILDVGAGRSPTLPRGQRPPGCTYVGLDISKSELAAAPEGSYDEVYVGDVVDYVGALDGRFDIVLSWQVLEHVKPLPDALEHIRLYLKPGGHFVGQLSGKFSVFGLLNQLIPHRTARWMLHRLIDRDPATVFPAPYHHCWWSALRRDTGTWGNFQIISRYTGANYFKFLKPLQRMYLAYEEWTIRRNRENLATHYLVVGTR